MVAVIVQPHQLHVGLPGEQPRHLGDARQTAAGEDVALDEVDTAQILGVALIGYGDGLNEQAAAGSEQARQLAEVVRQEGVPHRLYHLDGDQLVEAPLQLAVILQQQGDAIPQPLPGNPLFCVVMLGLGDSRSGHPAAVMAGGIDSQAAPAGAYLQQVILRSQLEPLADGAQLGLLPLLQGGLGARVDGARILHVAVEEALIEGVAEIIVSGDVGSRPGQGVAAAPMTHLVEGEAEPAESPLQGVEQRQVARQQPHQGHRIRAGPEPLHPGFTGGYAAPQQKAAIEGGILHHHLGVQVSARHPEAVALVAVPQQQLPLFEASQQTEQQLPGPLVDERGREG
ncbi:hypothetical protein D3C76_600190 [compost metagenome]